MGGSTIKKENKFVVAAACFTFALAACGPTDVEKAGYEWTELADGSFVRSEQSEYETRNTKTRVVSSLSERCWPDVSRYGDDQFYCVEVSNRISGPTIAAASVDNHFRDYLPGVSETEDAFETKRLKEIEQDENLWPSWGESDGSPFPRSGYSCESVGGVGTMQIFRDTKGSVILRRKVRGNPDYVWQDDGKLFGKLRRAGGPLPGGFDCLNILRETKLDPSKLKEARYSRERVDYIDPHEW